MLAVESALMCDKVGWADGATSMGAPKAGPVVRVSINSHLKAGKTCHLSSCMDQM